MSGNPICHPKYVLNFSLFDNMRFDTFILIN